MEGFVARCKGEWYGGEPMSNGRAYCGEIVFDMGRGFGGDE